MPVGGVGGRPDNARMAMTGKRLALTILAFVGISAGYVIWFVNQDATTRSTFGSVSSFIWGVLAAITAYAVQLRLVLIKRLDAWAESQRTITDQIIKEMKSLQVRLSEEVGTKRAVHLEAIQVRARLDTLKTLLGRYTASIQIPKRLVGETMVADLKELGDGLAYIAHQDPAREMTASDLRTYHASVGSCLAGFQEIHTCIDPLYG